MSMEIPPPKKPHFFKPILPGFKNGLKIPIGFLKYLKGHDHIEHAVLKRSGKTWLVKVNGRRLEDGWEKFAEEHDLQLGDFLIFRHEGDMDFDVSIFDSTHCDREYAEYKQENKETAKKFDLEEKPKPNIMSSRMAVPNVEAAKGLHLSHSRFICTMKSYNLSKCFLRVPSPFARINSLWNRRCMITIKDEQRSWTFRLYSNDKETYIGGRWRDFCVANCLKEGDRMMFEIVINREMPILKFRDLRGNMSLLPKEMTTDLDTDKVSTQDLRGNVSLQRKGKKTNLDTERVYTREKPKPNIKSSHEAVPDVEAVTSLPHFICTMKSYNLSKCFLQLPNPFARLHGLSNRKCTIMIRDEQRSWMFNLYSSGRHTCIRGRWRDFCVANCLKEGDHLMFEIVTNREKPILKFRDLGGNVSLQPEGKKTNKDTEKVSTQDPRGNASFQSEGKKTNSDTERVPTREKPKPNIKSPHEAVPDVEVVMDMPHFCCTLKSYHLSKCFLVPNLFARLHGLSNRKCTIMIRDEQRSWTFSLNSSSRLIYIGGRWRDFCVANCLKEGDRLMFEIVAKGEKPILKFRDMRGNTLL